MYQNVQQSAVIKALKKAWPTIYRMINVSVYTIMHIITNGIKSMVQQIKGGGGF
jgi:hypothetical protein